VWGEVPKALVVLKPNLQASETELLGHCRARLAHYKCPRSVEFLERLPRTGTGKVLKRDLRKKYWQGRETIRPEFAAREAKDTTRQPHGSSDGSSGALAAKRGEKASS